MDQNDFLKVAQDAVDTFPAPFRKSALEVLIRIEEYPDPQTLQELEIDDPFDLTGLYSGIPMTEKSFADPTPWPDTVTLYRQPILAEWRDRGDVDLPDLITHVVVHEFAHHFGWSDDDIALIDHWWE
ncbi:metallopeptidase family protein [Primorskyibacter sp. 2E107]|uniref:metallopeptidase family protein n=1 Tax=Primorskyibacter sp. 2E107 TaxID=3403458 RepID=UPI003AF628D2